MKNMKSITTLLGLGSSSATLLLLVHHQITSVSGDCLVEGDMMFMEGQSTGHIGLECLNSTSYDATDSVCGPDGTIIDSDAVYTCPETNPHCVQCGERGQGAALCLDTTDVPSNCVDESGGSGGCLVDDMMFMEGQIGQIGLECINSTSYDATETFCMADGTIVGSDAVLTCPEISPHCVQCGERGQGAALCLDTTDVPSNCVEDTEGGEESSGGGGGCLVGDIMYNVGDNIGHIGLECINATSYKARESFCMDDGTIQDNMDAEFTCPESSSYCVQCGVAGEIGSALCLESTEVPSDCATATAPSPTTPATTEQQTSPTTTTTTTSSGSIIMSVASMWIVMVAAFGSSTRMLFV